MLAKNSTSIQSRGNTCSFLYNLNPKQRYMRAHRLDDGLAIERGLRLFQALTDATPPGCNLLGCNLRTLYQGSGWIAPRFTSHPPPTPKNAAQKEQNVESRHNIGVMTHFRASTKKRCPRAKCQRRLKKVQYMYTTRSCPWKCI